MRTQRSVYVLNLSPDELRDRYDGEDYVFPVGEYTQIPVEAATLIFGFGDEKKDRAIQRLGWASTSNDMKRAIERLNMFQFHMEPPRTVQEHAPLADGTSSASVSNGGGRGEPGEDGEHEAVEVPTSTPPPKNLLAKLATAAAGG